MLYQKEKEELKLLIQTGYPLIYIVTSDERPVVQILNEIIDEMKEQRNYVFRTWDQYQYMFDEENGKKMNRKEKTEDGQPLPFMDPLQVMDNIRGRKENLVMVLHDFHHLYDTKKDKDRKVIRAMKHIAYDISMPFTNEYALKRYKNEQDHYYKHTIITSPILNIPQELEKLMYVIDFSLPQKTEIEDILRSIEQETPLRIEEEKESVMNALLGLTETEIFYSIKKTTEKNKGMISAKDLLQEKKQILKKKKLVEYVDTDVQMDDIGGMKEFIHWIRKRKVTFDENFREKYRIDIPKGMLLTGVQGCGKSFAVKALANDLELPLLRLDMGSLMSKWVGESDQNLREVIKLVETISPCVLWIDEIEKSMPNNQTYNHETTTRMFGHLLTWLQEKQSMVFVVATANNLEYLPPELLRKGRFDEIFFIDLPTFQERIEILSIHLKKKGMHRINVNFNLDALSEKLDGFSGAEIEVIVNESVIEAAIRRERLTDAIITEEIEKTNPLSKTMKDQIDSIREWAVKQGIRNVSSEHSYEPKKMGF